VRSFSESLRGKQHRQANRAEKEKVSNMNKEIEQGKHSGLPPHSGRHHLSRGNGREYGEAARLAVGLRGQEPRSSSCVLYHTVGFSRVIIAVPQLGPYTIASRPPTEAACI